MEDFVNPYQAPDLASAPPADIEIDPAMPLPLASTGQRLVNLIVDRILVQLVGLGIGIAIGIALIAADEDIAILEETSFLVDWLFGVALISSYYFTTECLLGRSLAKYLSGTRVVNEAGGRPSVAQLLGRTACRFIPFEPFSFLGGNGNPVGWHDRLSGTRVITTR